LNDEQILPSQFSRIERTKLISPDQKLMIGLLRPFKTDQEAELLAFSQVLHRGFAEVAMVFCQKPIARFRV